MNNPKRLKSWSKRNLAEDLWPDILSRLPVKSLLRFRSVSKSWLSCIDDPDFARLHLLRFNNNRLETHLILDEGYPTRYALRSTQTLRTTGRIAKPILRPYLDFCSIVSSIDGLFILKGSGYGYMMWNPSIRKTLPLPPLGKKSLNFGLGFDPLTKDYQYVRFGFRCPPLSVSVYSAGTRLWKKVKFRTDHCSTRLRRGFHFTKFDEPQSFCLRGFVFAIVKVIQYSEDPLELLSLDLSTEIFASIKVPVVVEDHYNSSLAVADNGFSPAVVNLSDKGFGSIWVLEGFGADITKWSWSKRYSFAMSNPASDCKFLFLGKSGKMLLKGEKMITSYNLETQQEKVLLKQHLKCSVAVPYIESLILLN